MDYVSTYPFHVFYEAGKQITPVAKIKGDVVIGNDVWIGRGAVILSGVKVGDNAVIGTMAIVARKILPCAIAVGIPAGAVKKRFDEDIIRRLLQINWWNWKEERIAKTIPLLMGVDIESFLEFAEEEAV